VFDFLPQIAQKALLGNFKHKSRFATKVAYKRCCKTVALCIQWQFFFLSCSAAFLLQIAQKALSGNFKHKSRL
jgi:hypothetical protein